MSPVNRPYRLHFVGIGGIGMSGIAEVFLTRGHRVSGSDISASDITERLVRMGAEIGYGHDAAYVKDADVVVISSAVKDQNPEVLEAKRRGISVIPRAEMLAEVMRDKVGIAVAGTHGKTTTTSMVAHILIQAGLDPTVVVGGKVESLGSNAKLGAGSLVVVEADESDGSFHYLPATYSIVTNIDSDHMDFFKSRENLDASFVQFTKKIPFFGCNWLCGDDAGVRKILNQMTKPCMTYGFQNQNDLVAGSISVQGNTQKFSVALKGKHLGAVQLSVLGEHNALNALGAIGVSISAGATFEAAAVALSSFSHVRRRFDERYYSLEKNIRIIDDYGHHPTEIKAVLATARQLNSKRIITIFQPHRYSRTQNSFQEFVSAFDLSDEVWLLPVYSAGEPPIEGVNSEALALAMQNRTGHVNKTSGNKQLTVRTVDSLEVAQAEIIKSHQPGDLILTLGAGSITQLATRIADAFTQQK
jgi:UDP-N-acetylmuramate--alanine ligase